MKKVGIVTSPLTSGHAVRGIGFYTKNLLEYLKKLGPKNGFEIIEISNNLQLTTLNLQLIHYPFFDHFSHTLPIFKAVKAVVTIHDCIPLEFPDAYPAGLRGSINGILQRIALKSTDLVITNSLATAKSVHRYLHVPHNKIRVTYLGVDEIYKPVTSRLVLNSVKTKYLLPDRFVLYVGDVNYNKNIVSLASVCLDLHIPLVIVGKQAAETVNLSNHTPNGFHPQDLVRSFRGQHHPQLAHLIKLESLFTSANILRLGFVPDADLAAIYSLATLYSQPSYAEGFGLPVLEALACGTPVLCSNTYSLPEIAGTAAEYFDPYNISEMASKLKNLFTNSKLRKILSSSGRIQAEKFTPQKTARETLKVYSEVI